MKRLLLILSILLFKCSDPEVVITSLDSAPSDTIQHAIFYDTIPDLSIDWYCKHSLMICRSYFDPLIHPHVTDTLELQISIDPDKFVSQYSDYNDVFLRGKFLFYDTTISSYTNKYSWLGEAIAYPRVTGIITLIDDSIKFYFDTRAHIYLTDDGIITVKLTKNSLPISLIISGTIIDNQTMILDLREYILKMYTDMLDTWTEESINDHGLFIVKSRENLNMFEKVCFYKKLYPNVW